MTRTQGGDCSSPAAVGSLPCRPISAWLRKGWMIARPSACAQCTSCILSKSTLVERGKCNYAELIDSTIADATAVESIISSTIADGDRLIDFQSPYLTSSSFPF